MSVWFYALSGSAIILATASAAVSAVETAIFSLNEEQKRILRRHHPAAAKQIERLLDTPRRSLNALLLADSLANLPLIFLCLFLIQEVAPGVHLPKWVLAAIAFAVIILICELLPKLFGVSSSLLISRVGARFASTIIQALGPAASWFQQISDRLVGRYHFDQTPESIHLHREEFLTLIDISVEEGTLRRSEAKILKEIVKLGEESASHCMTPRVDTFGIPDDLTNEEAKRILLTTHYHRVLVYGESPDDVLGILDVSKFLLNPEGPSYSERLLPPSFVPETMNALTLLRSFLQRKQHIAILLDEFGGIEGIVTLSDLIEELIGEEAPDVHSELYIEQINSDRILASGSARLDDIGDYLGFNAETETVDSLGGLIVNRIGYLPRPGASLQIGNWKATVRRATRKRIKEVLLERNPEK